jgi:hypothetical protein
MTNDEIDNSSHQWRQRRKSIYKLQTFFSWPEEMSVLDVGIALPT